MKATKLHSFLTSEMDESVESALCPDCFVPVERAPGKGGTIRVSLGVYGEEKISRPDRNLNSGTYS
jgi:hypothetical protein